MENRTFSRIGWTTVLYSVVGIIIMILMSLFTDTESEAGYNSYILTSQIVYYAVILGLVILMFRKLPKVPDMPKQRMYFSDFAIFFVISFSFLYLGAIIGGYVNEWLASLVDGKAVNPVDELAEAIPLWLSIILDLIIAPVFEELIFRKYILNALRPFGDLTACIVCGLLFGIFHMNLDQFFYAFLLGTLFSYIILRTNNILYTMLLHALVNLTGTLIVPNIYILFEASGDGAYLIINTVLYIIVIAGLTIFGFKCRYFIIKPPYFTFSMPINFKTVVFNSGFIAMIILFVLASVISVQPSWLY